MYPRRGTDPKIMPRLNVAMMQSLFPGFVCDFNRKDQVLSWRGELQPTDESPVYHVRITYKMGGTPYVKVISPEIRPGAPHLYSGGRLCLYDPKDRSWHPGLFIAKTIVPWTAEWLFFYELWLETGTWWGPSAPHPPTSSNN